MNFDLSLSNTLYKKNLDSYLRIAEDNIKLIAEQNDSFNERLKNEIIDREDWFDEGIHLNNITWLYLNAIYISLFSSFEHFIFKVAKKVESVPGTNIQLKHMANKGIGKYLRYLHLVGNLSSANPSMDKWGKIKQFQDIRNLLVHNGGIMQETITIPLEKHKNFKFLKSYNVVMAGNFGLIRIRNIKILKAFADITKKISDDIVEEYLKKFSNL